MHQKKVAKIITPIFYFNQQIYDVFSIGAGKVKPVGFFKKSPHLAVLG